ncbi:MAG: hypothetical protein DYG91_04165 [Chloroflexi bacterium CFX7]|nr:hypothetical protein [Chloroflexi bacterium CFX7]RIL02961.1 MAG: hypothetical protein DCC78_05835 [bacterium]
MSPQATATAADPGPKKLGTSAGVPTTARAPDFDPLTGATARFGTLGSSVYRIEVPESWNGELVLWAHGYAGTGSEVVVDSPPLALRRAIIADGTAWAASSYSENGYVPGIGADDTLALKRLFEREVGQPQRTYIAGLSMGGHVITLLLEYFPHEFDGALALCGVMTGIEQVDYVTSWALVAEFVSGRELVRGPGVSREQARESLEAIVATLGSVQNPSAAGLQFLSVIRVLTGGPRPFFLEGAGVAATTVFRNILSDVEEKLVPTLAASNEHTVYGIEPGLGLSPDQLNAGIVRKKADRAARNSTNHPDAVPSTGRITVPLLSLHNTGDLNVPISQEAEFRRRVEAAGAGDLLVQRAIRDGGHCMFTAAELTTAWKDLRSWVVDGQKPGGDDMLGDLTDVGRQFTNPIRRGDPGTR